jgi:hypothetical protein
MQDEVSSYLKELQRRLPPVPLRGRFLEEARDHIEDGGLEAFGPVDVVARRMRRELARATDRLATRILVVVVALYLLPLYVIPENTLPPAPWTEMPGELAWKLGLAEAAFVGAVANALFALVVRGALRRGALYTAVVSLGVSAAVTVPLAWQWPVGSGALAACLAAMRVALVFAAAAVVAMREVACAQRC